jgi:hypothetical protein
MSQDFKTAPLLFLVLEPDATRCDIHDQPDNAGAIPALAIGLLGPHHIDEDAAQSSRQRQRID